MKATDLDFIRRILSVAETGRAEWDPSAVYIYSDDNRFSPPRRQITLSIGFTEGGGNLKKVLERYCTEGGAQASGLKVFLLGLGDKTCGTLAGNQSFIGLLKAAGKEALMQAIQRVEFDRIYLAPAIKWGETYGFTLPLSFLVIADSFLHSGSMLPFLMAKFPEKKPVDSGNEKKWITDYLSARHAWLKNHSNTILNKTVYRADCYMREAAKGNWDLVGGPVVMHGTSVMRLMAFLAVFLGLLLSSAKAAPYLTCDPFPANADANLNVVQFVITFTVPTGLNPASVQAQIGVTGLQYMFYDLGPLTNATYTVTAAAVNGYGLEGPQSTPFTFQKGVPAQVSGLKIVPSIPVPLP
jgi:chitosanase